MAVTIKWQDNNDIETGHRIYKSPTYFTKDNLPTPLVDLGPDVQEYEDTSANPEENWYIVSAYIIDYEVFSDPFIIRDFNFGIGSVTFVGGDFTDGYLGEVPSTDFITGDALASAIGLTVGTSQNSNVPWWKFVIDDQVLYVPTKNFRYNIAWSDINNVNAVYNDSNAPIVTIGGYDFRVTLMTGAEADPTAWTTSSTADDNYGAGSEWNRLIYRVHDNVPTGGTETSHGGPQVGNNWDSYDINNTNIASGSGSNSWCQETSNSQSNKRITRGGNSLYLFKAQDVDYQYSNRGWRPALRLVK